MKKKILITLALLLGFSAVSVPAEARTHFKRVAYFVQWGVYGRDYHVRDVDVTGAAAKLTHLNYAFGFVNAGGECYSADPWADWQRSRAWTAWPTRPARP